MLIGLLVLCHKLELCDELDSAEAILRSLQMLRSSIEQQLLHETPLKRDTSNRVLEVLAVY